MGFPCARCREYTDPFATEGKDWFAIPRIHIEKGGKEADNCVIVCARCYIEIGQDGIKTIPYNELPYFKARFYFPFIEGILTLF